MPTISHKNVTWVDLKKPTASDIAFLKEQHGIHENPLKEIAIEAAIPKIEQFGNQLYLVLFFPLYNSERKTTVGKEIDFIVTKDTLITVHYDAIPPLEDLHKKSVSSPKVRNEFFSETSAHLLFIILSHLYDYLVRELSHIKKDIDAIDGGLFQTREAKLVEQILAVRQNIINFRRSLLPQRQILEALSDRGSAILGRKSKESFKDLIEAYIRVSNLLESHKDAIEAIHETNDSMLSARQNDTVQTLTMLSVVTFYMALVAAIFSVDAVNKPIVGTPYDFWIILGIMGGALAMLLLFFKKKKWL